MKKGVSRYLGPIVPTVGIIGGLGCNIPSDDPGFLLYCLVCGVSGSKRFVMPMLETLCSPCFAWSFNYRACFLGTQGRPTTAFPYGRDEYLTRT